MNIIFQLRVLFIRTVNESFEPSDAGFLVHRYSETELEEGLIDFETLSINSESDSPYCELIDDQAVEGEKSEGEETTYQHPKKS